MAQMGGVNSKEDTVKLSVLMKFTDAIAKIQTFFSFPSSQIGIFLHQNFPLWTIYGKNTHLQGLVVLAKSRNFAVEYK